jgi:hypothetical protein
MNGENRLGGPGPLPIRVESPKPKEALVVAFLGQYGGLDTHYYQRRSVACLGDEDCNPSFHRSRRIWKGYAPVQRWDILTSLWHQCVLEITEGVEHLLRGRDLRGEVWIFSREGQKRNGVVTAVYSEKMELGALSPSFDLLTVMRRFYHSMLIELDSPNMLPPKTYHTPARGPVPSCVAEATPEPIDPVAAKAERERLQEYLREGMRKNGFPGGRK